MLMQVVNRRRAIVMTVIAVAAIGVAILLYDFFMPAWVRVERTENREDNAGIVVLTNEDAIRYPILQRTMAQADEYYPRWPGGGVEKTSKSEAIEIATLLDIRNEAPGDRGNYIYDDKTYLISITYQYPHPVYVE